MIIPGAEPFYFPGNRIGCLLIHGFTGTPKEMRWMGEYLAQQGFSSLGIRLAGHATRPDDLIRCHWQDWLASVEDGWNLLSSHVDHICLIGLSMGGALALIAATRLPTACVVAIATPYELPRDPRLPFIKPLQWLLPKVEKGPPDWQDLEAAKDHIAYPYYPTRAIVQLRGLLAELRLTLHKITVPVLLVHSRQDAGVAPENMEKIFQALQGNRHEMMWVDNSGHVITREPAKAQVFEAAKNFIHRTCGEP